MILFLSLPLNPTPLVVFFGDIFVLFFIRPVRLGICVHTGREFFLILYRQFHRVLISFFFSFPPAFDFVSFSGEIRNLRTNCSTTDGKFIVFFFVWFKEKKGKKTRARVNFSSIQNRMCAWARNNQYFDSIWFLSSVW